MESHHHPCIIKRSCLCSQECWQTKLKMKRKDLRQVTNSSRSSPGRRPEAALRISKPCVCSSNPFYQSLPAFLLHKRGAERWWGIWHLEERYDSSTLEGRERHCTVKQVRPRGSFSEGARLRSDPHHRLHTPISIEDAWKVDTHVHHSAAMNAKHLLRFMKKKLKTCPHDIIEISPTGKPRTLSMMFESMGISIDDLSVDRLQVLAASRIQKRDSKRRREGSRICTSSSPFPLCGSFFTNLKRTFCPPGVQFPEVWCFPWGRPSPERLLRQFLLFLHICRHRDGKIH